MRGPVPSMTCQPGACGVAWLTRSTGGGGRTTSPLSYEADRQMRRTHRDSEDRPWTDPGRFIETD